MAREIDLTKPLSKDDVDYLSARYSAEYVARQVEISKMGSGGKGSVVVDPDADVAEQVQQLVEENERLTELVETLEAQLADAQAGAQGDGDGDSQEDPSDGTGDDDLIGDPDGGSGTPATTDYDPGEHTNAEVLAKLKTVSAEEREAILAAERDGRGRSGILENA